MVDMGRTERTKAYYVGDVTIRGVGDYVCNYCPNVKKINGKKLPWDETIRIRSSLGLELCSLWGKAVSGLFLLATCPMPTLRISDQE